MLTSHCHRSLSDVINARTKSDETSNTPEAALNPLVLLSRHTIRMVSKEMLWDNDIAQQVAPHIQLVQDVLEEALRKVWVSQTSHDRSRASLTLLCIVRTTRKEHHWIPL